MSKPAALLLDEHIWFGLSDALQQRGYDVAHVSAVGLNGIDDEPLLAWSAAQGRAVLTNNHRDFGPLVANWYLAGREHSGVILTVFLRPGELLKQTVRLLQAVPADDLRNTCRWLQEFKDA